jgi:hypothetical protein
MLLLDKIDRKADRVSVCHLIDRSHPTLDIVSLDDWYIAPP